MLQYHYQELWLSKQMASKMTSLLHGAASGQPVKDTAEQQSLNLSYLPQTYDCLYVVEGASCGA